MAVVYKGYNPALQRTVALKILQPGLTADQEFVRRFAREAQTAANLKHPNLVIIHDVEQQEVDGIAIHYIVMEFLPGRTLQEEIRQQGALPLDRVIAITRALADALDYVHQRGLTHRDIKPSNVMLSPDGHVTLMDFGIVKAAAGVRMTQEGVRIGTPEYMSPEQVRGDEIDHRSDIYSLGIVIYEMLTGRLPFQATSPHSVLYCHVHETPPPPSRYRSGLPPAVDKVILRALAKRSKQRFQTARQLAEALEDAIHTQSAKSEAQREHRFKLVDVEGHEYPLTNGIVNLGRNPDNHIQLADRRISRHHAQIHCQGAHCRIMDLGSVNGTYINWQRLPPHVPQPLQPGDQISLGQAATFTLVLGTAMEPQRKRPSGVSLTSTLRQKIWADSHRRAMALLGGGIILLALILCLLATSLTPEGNRLWIPSGQRAILTVINDTGQDLDLRIGDDHWRLKADQWKTIYFRAGEYDYTIILADGSVTQRHEIWHAGDNGQLYLVGEMP